MPNSLRIAVAGNQWITRYLIDALNQAGYPPKLVINMGGHWADRISGYEDLAADAERVGATLVRPSKYSLKSEEDERSFAGHEIDLLFVFGWQRLIPGWLIEKCKIGAFGVHGGPEKPPRCRGRAVFNWALILGYERFHMYAFRLTPGVDEGDIFGLTSFDISESDDILTLYHKNCVVSSRLFIAIAEAAGQAGLQVVPQANDGATYLPKREPDNGGVSWDQPAKRIADFVRAIAPPYPGAFSDIGGERVFIRRAQVFDREIRYEGPAGTIVDVFPNGDFVVQARDAAVYVRDWATEGTFLPAKGMAFAATSGTPLPDPIV